MSLIECPMRHDNGNCLPNGGFCLSVSKETCLAMQNAYQMGKDDAFKKIANKTAAFNLVEKIR